MTPLLQKSKVARQGEKLLIEITAEMLDCLNAQEHSTLDVWSDGNVLVLRTTSSDRAQGFSDAVDGTLKKYHGMLQRLSDS